MASPAHDLRQREREDARTIAQWWRDLWQRLTSPLRDLLARWRGLRLPSERQRDPLTTRFLTSLGDALTTFGRGVADLVIAAQRWAVTLGAAGVAVAHGLTLGRLANGVPVVSAQAQHAATAVKAVAQLALRPVVAVQDVTRAAGTMIQRGLLTVRNELYRGYRAGFLAFGRLRGRGGWYWRAELDRRTCPVCVARHGSYHTADETFDAHAGCRCMPQWDRPQDDGAQWFSAQDSATRTAILGPGKAALYDAGTITLADLVVPTSSPRWGAGVRVATLADLGG